MKEPMKFLNLEERKTSFKEVELGLNKESAKKESQRCLNCKMAPCKMGCPVGVDIPKFIDLISKDNVNAAYETILKDNLLPSICGRVCPQ